jgi:Flp pilus assembly protein TadG
LLVILVPVIFGLMGFALDLGRIYLIRGEVNHAAESMATAAAAELIGTQASLQEAARAAQLTIDDSSGSGNKYNFGSVAIGSSTGLLSSSMGEPGYFTTALAATAADGGAGDADGSTAKFVRVGITADAPLVFWSMLSLGQERRTPIAVQAVAGISSPLCMACGIEPLAIPAQNLDDTENFGFTVGTKYTLGYQCTAGAGPMAQTPAALAGTSARIPYLLLNRYDETIELDEQQQAYRVGAGGMLPSANSAMACVRITSGEATEVMWVSASPLACNTNSVPQVVTSAACGIYSRLDPAPPGTCDTITDIGGLATLYQPDTDIADMDDYAGSYTGNRRRIITVPIVEFLSSTDVMTVLGFRQFLVTPQQDSASTNPADTNGRFPVLYIGSAAPVKQGRFDGCTLAYGPGKVVLHQ